jgi:D-2-hydroxyacid dehydrogenase (NADP+)
MKIWLDPWTLKASHIDDMMSSFPEISFSTVLEESYDADAIICMPGYARKHHLEKFSQLKWIQLMTAGYDACDVSYILDRGILLTYAKDVFSIQIAEDVFSKILYFNRNIGIYHEQMKTKSWQHTPVRYEIAHATFGIIGAGSIGTEVATRAKAFLAKTIGYKRTPTHNIVYDELYHDRKGLEHLLKVSDYVIVAIPLNEQTRHMIGKTELSLMKPSALLINVARGDVIDQDALMDALNHQIIRGAGLDVTSPEPLPQDHPLWQAQHVYITPHNSSASPYVHQRLINEIKESIQRYLKSQPHDNQVKV